MATGINSEGFVIETGVDYAHTRYVQALEEIVNLARTVYACEAERCLGRSNGSSPELIRELGRALAAVKTEVVAEEYEET